MDKGLRLKNLLAEAVFTFYKSVDLPQEDLQTLKKFGE
jgi:hypothetical protein